MEFSLQLSLEDFNRSWLTDIHPSTTERDNPPKQLTQQSPNDALCSLLRLYCPTSVMVVTPHCLYFHSVQVCGSCSPVSSCAWPEKVRRGRPSAPMVVKGLTGVALHSTHWGSNSKWPRSVGFCASARREQSVVWFWFHTGLANCGCVGVMSSGNYYSDMELSLCQSSIP